MLITSKDYLKYFKEKICKPELKPKFDSSLYAIIIDLMGKLNLGIHFSKWVEKNVWTNISIFLKVWVRISTVLNRKSKHVDSYFPDVY